MRLTITLDSRTTTREDMLAALHDAQVGLLRTNETAGIVGNAGGCEAGKWELTQCAAPVIR